MTGARFAGNTTHQGSRRPVHRSWTAVAASLITAAALYLAGCSSSSNEPSGNGSPGAGGAQSAAPGNSKLVTVKFTEIGKDAGKLPVYIAIEKGFMAQHGIKLTIIDAHNGASAVQATLGHSTDVAEVGVSNVIAAQQAGGDIKVVAGESTVSPYSIEGAKDITSIDQLDGKTVAPGTLPTDVSTIYFNSVLEAKGVQPSQTKPIYVGGTSDRLAALKSGRVSAALLIPPANFEADALGYHNLALVADYSKLPHTGFATLTGWASSHKSTLISFLGAYLQGVAWLYNPANLSAAIDILVKYTGVTADVAKKSIDYFLKIKIYPADGKINLDALGKKMESVGALKKAYVNGSAVDLSYVTQAYAALH